MVDREPTCRMTIGSRHGLWQWDVDDWTLLCVLAVLSAEPESLGELDEALRRYLPSHRLPETGRPLAGWDETAELEELAGIEAAVTADGSWCLIDLVGRTVVGGPATALPDPNGCYQGVEPDAAAGVEDATGIPLHGNDVDNTFAGAREEEILGGASFAAMDGETESAGAIAGDAFPMVWFDTPAGWVFRESTTGWQQDVAERSRGARARSRVDARSVLFGSPLYEFLAERIRAIPDSELDPAEPTWREHVRAIHADWLMTPRVDLGDRTPRQLLLVDRERIASDLWHRSDQWSKQGFPPPGLERHAAAFRFGGFGTVEVVLYFELVRELIGRAAEHMREARQSKRRRPRRRAIVERLSGYAENWLSRRDEETAGRATRRELIELERQRIPMLATREIIDCDCPVCRARAEGTFGTGPAFEWFDGHHLELEDEFAFSLEQDREQWEWNQRAMAPPFDAGPEPSGDLPRSTPAESQLLEGDSVWKSSYVDWEAVAEPSTHPNFRKESVGFPLAELIAEVLDTSHLPGDAAPDRAERQRHCDALNDAFVRFCASQEEIAEQSAAQELGQHLEAVALAFPQLVSKSADLQSRLDQVLRLSHG